MKNEELSYFREVLLKQKEDSEKELKEMIENGIHGLSILEATNELSAYDNHPADLGSETYEIEKNMALVQHQKLMIENTNRALEKLNKGTYGQCDFCGREIDKERLEVVPEAHLCIECQKEHKAVLDIVMDSHSRPVEEEVLDLPFGKQFLDKDKDEGDDGLGILRRLESYGSADSIQDIAYVSTYKELNELYEDHFGIVDKMDTISNEQFEDQLE